MIAIIDYEAGNLTSVKRALTFLGQDSRITRNHDEVIGAERLIFPGVGAAGSAMGDLKRLGLDEALLVSAKEGTGVTEVSSASAEGSSSTYTPGAA